METLDYAVDGRIARITLNRPERGNGITLTMPQELADCVERANLDPTVHAIALAGAGKGFCGGYDLVEFGRCHEVGFGPLDDVEIGEAGGEIQQSITRRRRHAEVPGVRRPQRVGTAGNPLPVVLEFGNSFGQR